MLRFLLAAMLALMATPAAAGWLRADGPGFIAYSRGTEADLRARMLELQRFDTLARALTGLEPDPDVPPLTIYFLSRRDMERLNAGDLTAGFYTARPGVTFAALATDLNKRGTISTLFHEYTHHFMFQHTRAAYPSWYVEGFAEYLSTARFEPDFIEFGQADEGNVYQLTSGNWLSTKTLMTTPTHRIGGGVYAFYAQSWAMVHYLSRDPQRLAALKRYLALLTKGDKPEPAFAAAFGFTMDEFDLQVRRYVRGKRTSSTRLMTPPPAAAPVTITALPASADALLVPSVRLSTIGFAPLRKPRVYEEDDARTAAYRRVLHTREGIARTTLLKTVREAAGAASGDLGAQAVLAEAEVKLGDRAAGIKILDAGLAKAPKDAQLLYIRGITELEQAKALTGEDAAAARKRARQWLTRANAARPNDYRILAAHSATYGTDMPSAAVDVLLSAADLAPQVPAVQASAALALARRGDRDAAKARLAPIAAAPHGGEAAVAAAALIAAIDRGETLAEIPVDLTD
ncbi:hypothetical protein [Glacieibacterium frigidum]|uniref:DUF1570 domain-containing protein n=1 Tax=Glacieibacterium frigidum TaxID=2593303 RepID=A0A552U8I7_9SPHN|nr:hypothetical protein [Glacieibacterium frigidum]TRW14530.1 hypothetical protein FMM06_12570 [Glacieibacterium frigidum]